MVGTQPFQLSFSFAEFPSSKYMVPDALTFHCSGLSWRDFHKFATIFNLPAPLEHMPKDFLNKML